MAFWSWSSEAGGSGHANAWSQKNYLLLATLQAAHWQQNTNYQGYELAEMFIYGFLMCFLLTL